MSLNSATRDTTHFPPIVIDNGSDTIKAGLATQPTPTAVFPSLVGHIRSPSALLPGQPSYYVGHSAQRRKNILHSKYPIFHGAVDSWEDLQHLWEYAFFSRFDPTGVDKDGGGVGALPSEHAVMMTIMNFNLKTTQSQAEKMSEVLFEVFDVPQVSFLPTAVAALYGALGHCGNSSGVDGTSVGAQEEGERQTKRQNEEATGLVIESGHHISHGIPIYQGKVCWSGSKPFPFAGCDVTQQLNQVLTQGGYSFTTSKELQMVRHIKETLCYVAQDYDLEMTPSGTNSVASLSSSLNNNNNTNDNDHDNHNTKNKIYTLPDGQIITLSPEQCFTPLEILFQPQRVGLEHFGMGEIICRILSTCQQQQQQTNNIHHALCNNIVLSGGNTMFPGFDKRLEKEVLLCLQQEEKLKQQRQSIDINKNDTTTSSPTSTTTIPTPRVINSFDTPQTTPQTTNRQFLSWSGAALWSQQPQCEWIERKDYEEFGPSLVSRILQ